MNNTTTILLFISLIINTLFLVIAAIFIQRKGGLSYLLTKIFKTLNSDKFSSSNDYNPTYLHKTSQFEKLPKSEPGIILLGDSLTDEGEWAELLENPNIKKRGISGDTTNRILNRLNEIVDSKPKKIFLMVGINDLVNDGKSVEQILEVYKNILTDLRNKIPNTEVFVQSVLPVNNKVTRYWQNNNHVLKLNSYLRDLAKEFTYQYIDVFSHLLDSQNQLDAQYTLDGLHLNGQGYLVWKEVIKKYVVDHELQHPVA